MAEWIRYVMKHDVVRFRKSHSSVYGAYYRWVSHGRSEECAICYRSFVTLESILFVCGHRFCTECVERDKIQKRVYKCALCRTTVHACYYRYKFNQIRFSAITTSNVPQYGHGSPFLIIACTRFRVKRLVMQFVIRILLLVTNMLKCRTQSVADTNQIVCDIV
eukprot:844974_1